MPRTATETFLTGRKVRVDGFFYHDDDGNRHDDVFLCVGPHPHFAGVMRVQDVIDGDFSTAHTDMIHPID